MRRGGAGAGGFGRRRLPKSSLASSSAADATPALDPICRNLNSAFNRRDSDASSLCSSRPPHSSAAPNVNDRAVQAALLRDVNAFLAPAVTLRPPLPAARDILTAFRLVLESLGYPLLEKDFEDDILYTLRVLACPHKVTRSALKAPGTPHSWPPLLAVLHWLTTLAGGCVDAALSSTEMFNDLVRYTTQAYSYFIEGDDEEVAALDDEYVTKARAHAEAAAEATRALEKEAQELEAKRTKLTSGPKRHEALQAGKAALTEDAIKFESLVKTWSAKVSEKEATKVNEGKVLAEKLAAKQRLADEIKVLSEKVMAQDVNVRDVERMHKEMQMLDDDNAQREKKNETRSEKGWEIDSGLAKEMDGIEGIIEKCNQVLNRLKPNINFQYSLNTKGSSPAELLGSSYKTEMKPALKAYSEEIKRISTLLLEECADLQKQVKENVKILEEKKNNLSSELNKTDKMFAQLNTLDHEIGDDESRCEAEIVKMTNEYEMKVDLMSTLEKEAADFLNKSEQKLQDRKRKSEEETQLCAKELMDLMKSVSIYKEFMEDAIAQRKKQLSETAAYIASLVSMD